MRIHHRCLQTVRAKDGSLRLCGARIFRGYRIGRKHPKTYCVWHLKVLFKEQYFKALTEAMKHANPLWLLPVRSDS